MIKQYEPKYKQDLINCQIALQEAEHKFENNRRTGQQAASEYIESLLNDVSSKNGQIFVAIEDNKVAGYLAVLIEENESIEIEGRYVYISDVIVLEEFRGKGVGQSLLKSAEEFAVKNNLTELRIGSLAKNLPALNLYRKMGYNDLEVSLRKFI